MRLSKQEIKILKSTVNKLDSIAKLYLFGSRTQDNKKGGDIDILIKSELIGREEIRIIRNAFFERFGEQKMDILVQRKDTDDAFIDKIQPQLVML